MTGTARFDPVSLRAAAELQRSGQGGRTAFLLPAPRHREALREHFLLQPCPVGAARVAGHSFRRLTRHLLDRAGDRRRSIAGSVIPTVLESLTAELAARGEIAYFSRLAGAPGLAGSLAVAFSRLQEAAIEPDALAAALAAGQVSPRERELLLLYRAYHRFLDENSLLDPGRALLAAIQAVRDHGPVVAEYQHVFVDHHLRLTGAEAALLQALQPALATLRVSLPAGSEGVGPDLMGRLSALLPTLPVHLYPAMAESETCPPALAQLQRQLFADEVEPFPADGRVTVIAAPSPEREYARVAAEIRRLAAAGVPWRDVVVMHADSGDTSLLTEVLRDEGVPLGSPEACRLSVNPAVRALLLLLDQTAGRGAGFDLLRLLRSDYLWPDQESAAALREVWPENGLRLAPRGWSDALSVQIDRLAARVTRLEALTGETPGDDEDSAGQLVRLTRESHRLHVLRDAARQLEALLAVMELFPDGAPVETFVDRVAQAVALLDLPRRVLAAESPAEIRARDWAAIHALSTLLEETRELGGLLGEGGDDLTLPGFLRLFRSALDDYQFNLSPATPGGVALAGVREGLGLSYRYVFVVGLSEGSLPPRQARDWLWTEAFVRRLGAAGLGVELPEVQAAYVRASFRGAVGAAREGLCLSYPEADTLGSTNLVSPYLQDVLRCFVPDTVARLRVNLAEMRCTPLRDGVSAARRVQLERSRYAKDPGPWSGLVDMPAALAELQARYAADYRWSVSRLGEYATCPFRYFAGRELGLAAIEELGEELSAPERGRMLHAILREFYAGHRGEDLRTHDLQELQAELRGIALRHLDSSPGERLALHPRLWSERKERLVDTVTRVLASDLSLAEKSGGTLRPTYLEWSFGRVPHDDNDPSSTPQPFVLRGEAEDLLFAGVVDRVDVDAGNRFMVYDYKSGKTLPQYSEIARGENLQLPLYALAVQELLLRGGEAVGAGFYSLPEPGTPSGLFRKELAGLLGAERKRLGLIDSADWDRELEALAGQLPGQVHGIRHGRFTPGPRDEKACRTCDFRPACRWRSDGEEVDVDE